MTSAPDRPLLAFDAAPGGTMLLPAREAVLARLAEQLPSTDGASAALLVVGLLRRGDGPPIAPATLAQVTTVLARSLRGEDWLGSAGPAEFAVVMSGSVTGAEAAAGRLMAGIARLDIPGVSAAAGLAALGPELTAGEVLRRATVSLTAARRVGPRTVVQHRLPY